MGISQLFCIADPLVKYDRIQTTIEYFCMSVIAGLVVIVLYALGSGPLPEAVAMAGVGILLAGGLAFSGGLLGFLFGIPRMLQEPGPAGNSASTGAGGPVLPAGRYQANTNLEQISDWLSKILVGVGLTQLVMLPGALQYFATTIAPAMGGYPRGAVFSIAIVIFFSVDGFFIGYLWTRRYFACELTQSDLELRQLEADSAYKTEREKQDKTNMEVYRFVKQVLNPPPDMPPVVQDDLNKKIASVGEKCRSSIFNKASGEIAFQNKAKYERIEKVFRALIACDRDEIYHKNHAQLAFLLHQKPVPQWEGARDEYTKAIEIRDRQEGQEGYLWYEANRAYCRIHCDEAFRRGEPGPEMVRKAVIEDLEAAAADEELYHQIKEVPAVEQWMELNHYQLKRPSPGESVRPGTGTEETGSG